MVDKKSCKEIFIYYIGYETWSWYDHEKTLYIKFNKINTYIEDNSRNKYLTLILVNENKEETKKSLHNIDYYFCYYTITTLTSVEADGSYYLQVFLEKVFYNEEKSKLESSQRHFQIFKNNIKVKFNFNTAMIQPILKAGLSSSKKIFLFASMKAI